MAARVLIGFGVLCCAAGALWTGQGVGLIGGSFMSGHAIWAVIGVAALLFGGALIRAGVRVGRLGPPGV